MRIFEKSQKLNNVSYDVRGPVPQEAARMEARGEKVLKLNIGNPGAFGFEVPEPIRKAMKDAIDFSGAYSESSGVIEAREAIAAYCAKKGIQGVTPEYIFTGNGASELISMLMQTMLDPGDEVLIPAPDYPLWTASVNLAGGKAVHYICDESSEWYPDIADIEKKISGRTKALLIINPNNPTGALYPIEIIDKLVDIARRHDLILLSDEIYDKLLFEGYTHVSTASRAPDVLTFTFNGLSKSVNACGYRVGWMCISGPKENAAGLLEGIVTMSSMRLCSNVPAQRIIPFTLEHYAMDPDFVTGGRMYNQREMMTKMLNDIPGVSVVKPKAAFYIFPKFDADYFRVTDDQKLAMDLLKEKKILIINGRGFNYPTPDHYRLVYLADTQTIKTAMDELGDFLAKYAKR